MTKKILLILTATIILGAFLRFYNITKNPTSLTGDEISFGYAAYSILKTTRDESGKKFPLVIKSIGDYKNPLPAYLMVLSFKVFGENDFSIRFQNALFGTLAIPLIYFFFFYLTKNKNIALLGALSTAISSWLIFYSRFAYEPLIASVFAFIGIWCFLKIFDKSPKWAIASSFFFLLTMYTGFAPRLFIPIFVSVAFLLDFKKIKSKPKNFVIFTLVSIILGLPLLYITLFQGASTRFGMVFIGNDVEFSRSVLLSPFKGIAHIPYLFFYITTRYLNYLNPKFLFVNGLNMVLPTFNGLGIMYLFEIPIFIYGIWIFITKDIKHKKYLAIWLFTGIIPDSITNNAQHSGRLLQVFPVVILILTLGFYHLAKKVYKLKNKYIKLSIALVFGILVLINLAHAFLVFRSHFPIQKGESFDEGLREVVYSVLKVEDGYDKIFFDTRRVDDTRHSVSNPFMYLLFYSKYDPFKYQNIEKIYNKEGRDPYFEFDKYIFGNINWVSDSKMEKTLFVGSPFSFPPKDELESQAKIIDTIYLSNGEPGFYLVEPIR